jgi:hypothetical protein
LIYVDMITTGGCCVRVGLTIGLRFRLLGKLHVVVVLEKEERQKGEEEARWYDRARMELGMTFVVPYPHSSS